MIAVTNEQELLLLDFADSRNFNSKYAKFITHENKLPSTINGQVAKLLKVELDAYFSGELLYFTVKVQTSLSTFQTKVLNAVSNIPYGQTTSYADLACVIKSKNYCRAVAMANAANTKLIITPCHRVKGSKTNDIGGYSGGQWRKIWLLEHEAKVINDTWTT